MFLHNRFVFCFHNNLFLSCTLSVCVNLLSKHVSYRYCDLGSNLSSIKSLCSFVFEHLIYLHLRLLLLSEGILRSFCTLRHTSDHGPLPKSRGGPIRIPILFPEVPVSHGCWWMGRSADWLSWDSVGCTATQSAIQVLLRGMEMRKAQNCEVLLPIASDGRSAFGFKSLYVAST